MWVAHVNRLDFDTTNGKLSKKGDQQAQALADIYLANTYDFRKEYWNTLQKMADTGRHYALLGIWSRYAMEAPEIVYYEGSDFTTFDRAAKNSADRIAAEIESRFHNRPVVQRISGKVSLGGEGNVIVVYQKGVPGAADWENACGAVRYEDYARQREVRRDCFADCNSGFGFMSKLDEMAARTVREATISAGKIRMPEHIIEQSQSVSTRSSLKDSP